MGTNAIRVVCIDTLYTHCSIDTIFNVNASNFAKFKPQFNLDKSVKNSCATEVNFELKTKPLFGADSIFFMYFDSSLNRSLVLNASGQDSVYSLMPFNQSAQVNALYVLQKNNEFGCEAVSETGYLRFLPDIGLEVSATTIPNSKLIAFQSNSQYPFQKIVWDFGDSQIDSSEKNPTHAYINSGNYLVKTMVMDTLNCSDTTSISVFISATGIQNNESITGLKLFPNPAQEILSISANSNLNQVLNLVIYDLTGKLVMNPFPLHFVNGLNDFSLKVSDLKSGVYLLSIESKNASLKQLLIKD